MIDDPHNAQELASAMGRFTDRDYRECVQRTHRTGTKWTFEHHYQALLDVFGEVRKSKQAA